MSVLPHIPTPPALLPGAPRFPGDVPAARERLPPGGLSLTMLAMELRVAAGEQRGTRAGLAMAHAAECLEATRDGGDPHGPARLWLAEARR